MQMFSLCVSTITDAVFLNIRNDLMQPPAFALLNSRTNTALRSSYTSGCGYLSFSITTRLLRKAAAGSPMHQAARHQSPRAPKLALAELVSKWRSVSFGSHLSERSHGFISFNWSAEIRLRIPKITEFRRSVVPSFGLCHLKFHAPSEF